MRLPFDDTPASVVVVAVDVLLDSVLPAAAVDVSWKTGVPGAHVLADVSPARWT
jgi:hypothetical protein